VTFAAGSLYSLVIDIFLCFLFAVNFHFLNFLFRFFVFLFSFLFFFCRFLDGFLSFRLNNEQPLFFHPRLGLYFSFVFRLQTEFFTWRKKLIQFSHNVWKDRLANTVTIRFNTTMMEQTDKPILLFRTNDRNFSAKMKTPIHAARHENHTGLQLPAAAADQTKSAPANLLTSALAAPSSPATSWGRCVGSAAPSAADFASSTGFSSFGADGSFSALGTSASLSPPSGSFTTSSRSFSEAAASFCGCSTFSTSALASVGPASGLLSPSSGCAEGRKVKNNDIIETLGDVKPTQWRHNAKRSSNLRNKRSCIYFSHLS